MDKYNRTQGRLQWGNDYFRAAENKGIATGHDGGSPETLLWDGRETKKFRAAEKEEKYVFLTAKFLIKPAQFL